MFDVSFRVSFNNVLKWISIADCRLPVAGCRLPFSITTMVLVDYTIIGRYCVVQLRLRAKLFCPHHVTSERAVEEW